MVGSAVPTTVWSMATIIMTKHMPSMASRVCRKGSTWPGE